MSFTATDTKNEAIGWLLIGVVGTQIAVNLAVMLWEISTTLKNKMCKKKVQIEASSTP